MDEPLTPAGRLFIQPEMNQIITCAIGQKHPINVDALKAEFNNSIMITLPRFTSLMVRDRHGLEHWKKTQVDIDSHLIIRHEPVVAGLNDEDAVNDYLADLAVSTEFSLDKPLWEMHLLMAHNCIILRVHHALGDGISLVSMLLACCRRVHDPDQPPTIKTLGTTSSKYRTSGDSREWKLWKLVQVVWFSLVFSFEFVLRSLWVRDKTTVVRGGAGVELWPRKMATAKFQLGDMKTVKKAVADATINDVLFGIISSGLSKYLDIRSSKALKEGLQITGIATVNLRSQPGSQDVSELFARNSGSRWGNQFGVLLLPVYYHRDNADPLQYVKRAKKMLDKKKRSLEAHFSYKVCSFLMSYCGAKCASLLNYRIICNTTFLISNMVGPQEEISLVGNPVNYLRANTSSGPHAITMHMTSYAGRADMQILVAKEIIPDPQVLVKCFQDSLLELKEAAEAAIKT